MDYILGGLPVWAFWVAVGVTVFAGFVKGALGFAMPLIMISGFSSFMPTETALAGLVMSVISTNLHQSLRQGWREAWASVVKYRRIIAMTCLGIMISAPLLPILPQKLLLGLLGVPVLAFALVQLMGIPLKIRIEHRTRAEYALGTVGGLYGGISGVWGPPLLVYLLSVGTDKQESVRVQGVVFLLGAVVLLFAHLGTGVLNAVTIPFSAILILPAAVGMLLGFRLQDRLDATRFRRWTQILLAVTALNLIRMSLGF
jgi:uncharacterized protein